jgi:uncharacterized protein YkwD
MLKYTFASMLAVGVANADITMIVEDPYNGAVVNGVRNIRGWAVSDVPIESVKLYFNGILKGAIPYGGTRKDVERAYPDVPGSLNSGFSFTWNFGIMDEGVNTVKVEVTDTNGLVAEEEVTFEVNAFTNAYMRDPSIGVSALFEKIDETSFIMRNAGFDGQSADITFKWETESQTFAINSIKYDGTPDNVSFTSNYKEETLAEVNEMRTGGYTCGETYYAPTTPLVWHDILGLTALEHSIDMASNNYFSHTSLDGSSPWERVADNGYSANGEVIAAGTSTPGGVFSLWKDSPSHCAILMFPNSKEIGLGAAYNNEATYGTYWTAMTN